MSLMGTLAKVAIGVAIAKGVSGLMQGQSASGQNVEGDEAAENTQEGGGGLEGMLGSVLGGTGQDGGEGGLAGGLGGMLDQFTGGTTNEDGTQSEGGLSDILGQLTGGTTNEDGTESSGGLGDMLGQLTGGTTNEDGTESSGGLGDMLGSLTGGASGGALGGVLGGLAGAAAGGLAVTRSTGGSFGDLFNTALQNQGEPETEPSLSEEAVAALMLRAMIQAAKSDGEIDEDEQRKLMDNLGEVSEEERAFVQQELDSPVDVAGLAEQVPAGLERQVYTMSVMGIDLDHKDEEQYLRDLAAALSIEEEQINAIHDQLQAPRIFA